VVLWFGAGCAGVALVPPEFFVRIDRAKSDLIIDEKAELEAEVRWRSMARPAVGVLGREETTDVDATVPNSESIRMVPKSPAPCRDVCFLSCRS
jgi:hypothetical protein